jgi:curved DNA-binding protein CbpA
MLLRKTRQLRRGAAATELLDLPANAKGRDARRALRRLASAVHPDRFGEAAPDAIQRASNEVMTALLRAQRDLG